MNYDPDKSDKKSKIMEKLKQILSICLIAISQVSISQFPPPPNQGSRADSLKNEGDIPVALAEYKKIYKVNPKDRRNVYNYACALSINRQIDSCLKYLNIAVRMDTSIASLIDPDFLTARRDLRWVDFENNLISMINAKFKNPYSDIEYAKALWKLRAYDQAYFSEVVLAFRKTGRNSSVHEALLNYQAMIHEMNQNELEKLIAAKGWPRIKDVGREAAMAAYLVIQHSNSELQKKYLPTVKKICDEKELPWERYALMYDRSQFNENKPQRYGTHTKYNESTNSEELYPLEDESKVDEWRKEIGLQPLAEYLARFNIKFQSKKNKGQ
jgi:hypothetical protein